ncbi:MAG: phosphoribosylanthranilate isomerase [Syntrophobacteraceae bacterium]|jgi:phosphoribosylanthranilate isomerase/indole-3-glycerol phosphate synthase/phosphoribosylanthranilate isomerase|nr:phosphoribosylanthranilate isomerase [Syntrophobacteraceae bacterium]
MGEGKTGNAVMPPRTSGSEVLPAPEGEASDRLAPVASVQVKICGLTDEAQALECVRLGADAIGLVFFPRSPRSVSDEKARSICREVPDGTCTVGVFVNETFEAIMRRVEFCGLRGAQLHGDESPELAARLSARGLVVLKAFFANGHPSLAMADRYPGAVCLVESTGGPLPGGNALAWDWAAARDLAATRPTVLAGGLHADNVREAIESALPDAVDVSSGVESSPGVKDLDKVKLFISRATQGMRLDRRVRPVFF